MISIKMAKSILKQNHSLKGKRVFMCLITMKTFFALLLFIPIICVSSIICISSEASIRVGTTQIKTANKSSTDKIDEIFHWLQALIVILLTAAILQGTLWKLIPIGISNTNSHNIPLSIRELNGICNMSEDVLVLHRMTISRKN